MIFCCDTPCSDLDRKQCEMASRRNNQQQDGTQKSEK